LIKNYIFIKNNSLEVAEDLKKEQIKLIFNEVDRQSKLDFDELPAYLGALIENEKEIRNYYEDQNFSIDFPTLGKNRAIVLAEIGSELLDKFREQMIDLFNDLGGYDLLEEKGAKSVEEISVLLSEIALNNNLAPLSWIVACSPIVAKELMEPVQAELSSVRDTIYLAEKPDDGSQKENRYADFVFFGTKNMGKTKGEQVPEGHALNANKWFMLEVAVRPDPVGIPHETNERLGIIEPRRENDVRIFVTVEGDGFEIKDRIQTLVLPPYGESKENALFRIRPIRKTTSLNDLAEITIRLYYKFNLLEMVSIKAEIIGENDGNKSNLGLDNPISFRHRMECEVEDFDEIIPRAMHINIGKVNDQYHLKFLFFSETQQEIVFTAPIPLRATDLEDELLAIRTILHRIQLYKFSDKLEGDKNVYPDLRELAIAGANLWNKVFKLNINSSLFWIGKFLQSNPIINGSIIQISVDDNASDFVFPWSLLYDGDIQQTNSDQEHELPDLDGFWGIRYQIEQHLPIGKYNDVPIPCHDGLNFSFMLGSNLAKIKEQKKLLINLQQKSKGKMKVSDPPIDTNVGFLSLLKDCDSEILYFYSHGYTRHRRADIGVGNDFQIFKKIIEKLSKTDPVFLKNKSLYDNILAEKFENEDSWIQLKFGRVYLNSLYAIDKEFKNKPIVILNMCESAQVTPSLAESFISFFIDRGASCVIGTECPMTTTFAHPFSDKLLNGLLQGEKIGEVLLNARRYFLHDLKNPLGLAYTIYGSGAICLSPKLV
jgi:hypothetical protein